MYYTNSHNREDLANVQLSEDGDFEEDVIDIELDHGHEDEEEAPAAPEVPAKVKDASPATEKADDGDKAPEEEGAAKKDGAKDGDDSTKKGDGAESADGSAKKDAANADKPKADGEKLADG